MYCWKLYLNKKFIGSFIGTPADIRALALELSHGDNNCEVVMVPRVPKPGFQRF